MKVELEKTFPMPVTADTAWAFLQNIEGVAACVPGARITERADDGRYRGTINVRIGPASLSFKGDIEVIELDASQRTLRLTGKGSDTSGTSGASMNLTARIEPGTDANTSALVGKSEVSVSGKAAAFGGRMMNAVADQLLKQFAANFASESSKLAACMEAPATTTQADVAQTGASQAVTPQAAQSGATRAGGSTQPTLATSGHASSTPQAASRTAQATSAPLVASASHAAPPAMPPPAQQSELNALSLLWAVVRDWFRGLLKRGAG